MKSRVLLWSEEEDERFCWKNVFGDWFHRAPHDHNPAPQPRDVNIGGYGVESDVDSGCRVLVPSIKVLDIQNNATADVFNENTDGAHLLDAKGTLHPDVAVVASMATIDKTQ